LNILASFLCICLFLSNATAKSVPMNTTDLMEAIKEQEGWSENFINGGAELYFSYNFKELCVQEYQDNEKTHITVEIYEMDRSENAYGVYSFDTDGEHPDIGNEATYGYGLLKFWKDRFFIRIFSSSEEETVRETIFIFGSALASKIYNKGMKPWIVSKIPANYIGDRSSHV